MEVVPNSIFFSLINKYNLTGDVKCKTLKISRNKRFLRSASLYYYTWFVDALLRICGGPITLSLPTQLEVELGFDNIVV